MTKAAFTSGIELRGLVLPVVLGWLADERQQPQQVVVDFNLKFLTPPKACVSDNLEDTFCYDTLTATLRQKVIDGEFRLLEHLGHEIYQHIKSYVNDNTKVGVRVKKQPPIANLSDGVYFYVGDENISW
jgi:7,8-dihydroneopterin aldolase/epimerase/oxygenase